MTRGTITITNVGTFGVDNGTPILNPGESAILCFSAVRPTPWVVDGQVCVRQVTQLALSFGTGASTVNSARSSCPSSAGCCRTRPSRSPGA